MNNNYRPDKKSEDLVDEMLSRLVLLCAQNDDRSTSFDFLDKMSYSSLRGRLLPILSAAGNVCLPEEDFQLNMVLFKRLRKADWCQMLIEELLKSSKKAKVEDIHVLYKSKTCHQLKFVMQSQPYSVRINDLEHVYKTAFFADVNKLVSNDNLFKRSFMFIKAWLLYEAQRYIRFPMIEMHSFVKSGAVEVMVMSVFSLSSAVSSPLAALVTFLEYFAGVDWNHWEITAAGPIDMQSLSPMPSMSSLANDIARVAEKYQKLWLTSAEAMEQGMDDKVDEAEEDDMSQSTTTSSDHDKKKMAIMDLLQPGVRILLSFTGFGNDQQHRFSKALSDAFARAVDNIKSHTSSAAASDDGISVFQNINTVAKSWHARSSQMIAWSVSAPHMLETPEKYINDMISISEFISTGKITGEEVVRAAACILSFEQRPMKLSELMTALQLETGNTQLSPAIKSLGGFKRILSSYPGVIYMDDDTNQVNNAIVHLGGKALPRSTWFNFSPLAISKVSENRLFATTTKRHPESSSHIPSSMVKCVEDVIESARPSSNSNNCDERLPGTIHTNATIASPMIDEPPSPITHIHKQGVAPTPSTHPPSPTTSSPTSVQSGSNIGQAVMQPNIRVNDIHHEKQQSPGSLLPGKPAGSSSIFGAHPPNSSGIAVPPGFIPRSSHSSDKLHPEFISQMMREQPPSITSDANLFAPYIASNIPSPNDNWNANAALKSSPAFPNQMHSSSLQQRNPPPSMNRDFLPSSHSYSPSSNDMIMTGIAPAYPSPSPMQKPSVAENPMGRRQTISHTPLANKTSPRGVTGPPLPPLPPIPAPAPGSVNAASGATIIDPATGAKVFNPVKPQVWVPGKFSKGPGMERPTGYGSPAGNAYEAQASPSNHYGFDEAYRRPTYPLSSQPINSYPDNNNINAPMQMNKQSHVPPSNSYNTSPHLSGQPIPSYHHAPPPQQLLPPQHHPSFPVPPQSLARLPDNAFLLNTDYPLVSNSDPNTRRVNSRSPIPPPVQSYMNVNMNLNPNMRSDGSMYPNLLPSFSAPDPVTPTPAPPSSSLAGYLSAVEFHPSNAKASNLTDANSMNRFNKSMAQNMHGQQVTDKNSMMYDDELNHNDLGNMKFLDD